MKKNDSYVTVEGFNIRLTNVDKVLWPEYGITKGDYIKYLVDISPYILKYLQDRAIVFTRYPDGIHGKSFYQKNCPNYAPEWIKIFSIKSSERSIRYILVDDIKTLVWVGNQACIEFHPWHSRIGSLDFPDYAIFDLDPMGNTDFDDALQLAAALKKALDLKGIKSFPKTSGASGLQVYVPLEPIYTYKQVQDFTKFFSMIIVNAFPKKTTIVRQVDKREGKLYMDYLQNIKGKTIIAPYSVRPRPEAAVSAPLTWDEVIEGNVDRKNFTIRTILDRVKDVGDLFSGAIEEKQNIDSILKFIEENRNHLEGF